jgi:FkbM family methyltransferase
MQKQIIHFMGRRFELWLHPDPDHLAAVIKASKTFYEIDVLMKCREIYLPGTTIVDVGANTGNHTMFFAGVLGAPVHAFEPFAPSFELLGLNVYANGLQDRVRAVHAAVGAQDGMAIVTAGPVTNLGMTKCAPGAGEIPMLRLDSADIAEPVGLLKIDVEGEEVSVLSGAAELLRAWLPDVMVEAGEDSAFAAVATHLLGCGYVPRGRFAATATYLFSAVDQAARMRKVLGAVGWAAAERALAAVEGI